MASPPSHSPTALSLASNTPPTSTSPSPPSPPVADINIDNPNSLDDIFFSTPPADYNPLDALAPAIEQSLSDLPALRRQHVTAGYREGLAITKAKTIQEGFDDGYPVGVELGLRVGRVLGCLEAVAVGAEKQGVEAGKLRALLTRAEREIGEVASFLAGVSDDTLLGDWKWKGLDAGDDSRDDGDQEDGGVSLVDAGDGMGKGSASSGKESESVGVLARAAMEKLRDWELALGALLGQQAPG